jgi:hypothetical protein
MSDSVATLLLPRYHLVQGLVNELARYRSRQIKLEDRSARRRARVAELNEMSWWWRFVAGLNGERKRHVKRLATLDREAAKIAYEIDIALRTIEDMLGQGDLYLLQVKRMLRRAP